MLYSCVLLYCCIFLPFFVFFTSAFFIYGLSAWNKDWLDWIGEKNSINWNTYSCHTPNHRIHSGSQLLCYVVRKSMILCLFWITWDTEVVTVWCYCYKDFKKVLHGHNTLNNWLIEITGYLLNGFVFTRTFFRANFKFKGKNSHRSISVCSKQLL